MLQSEEAVSRAEVTPPPPADASPPVTVQTADATASTQIPRLRWRTITAVPIAALVAVGVHFLFSSRESPVDTHSYALLYWEIIGVSIVLAVMQQFSAGLRRWMQHMCPIFTAAILLFAAWDVITLGLRLLPLPYFPGPAAVLRSLVNDRSLLFDSTWHSLFLLLTGYSIGVVVGLISGVSIGWFAPVRYW